MAFTKRTYSGKGRVSIGAYGIPGPLLPVGNVSELTFNLEEGKVSVEDFTQPGGGEYDSIRRVNAVTLAMTKWDILLPLNLEMAVRGITSAQNSVIAIVGEPHVAYKGGLIVLDRIPNHAVAITVTDDAEPPVPLVEGVGYIRRPSGIEILDPGPVADATDILVSYTPLASDTVEALVASGKKYRLFFEGLNEADSDRPVLIDVHQYKPGVAQSLGWISSEFASMQTAGDVLKDTSIVGDNLSKYFRVRSARPV